MSRRMKVNITNGMLFVIYDALVAFGLLCLVSHEHLLGFSSVCGLFEALVFLQVSAILTYCFFVSRKRVLVDFFKFIARLFLALFSVYVVISIHILFAYVNHLNVSCA